MPELRSVSRVSKDRVQDDRLRYDPRLVEEAVFLALRGHRDEPAFRAEQDRVYEIADAEQRDRAFERQNMSWFTRLGLDGAIRQAFGEQPLISDRVRVCVIGRAVRRKDEAAELFVGPVEEENGESERRSVGLLLRPQSLLDPASLLTFLRHELLHISDMLNPAFAYEPELPRVQGGPTYDLLLRDRYRTLWDTTIDGRLVRLGWAPASRRDACWREFIRAFPTWKDDEADLFGYFFDHEPHTHAELVAFACNTGMDASGMTSVLHAGSRCALCQFPTYAFEPKADALPAEVIVEINEDFPQWRPQQGLCPQCADLYRARLGFRRST